MKKTLQALNELGREGPVGKEAYRAKQRKLTWPEKVRVVVELQKIAQPIMAARGKAVTVWPQD